MEPQAVPLVLVTCGFALAVTLLLARIARQRSEPWIQLARQTGLTLDPSSVWRSYSVHGTYRGRQVHKAKLAVGDWPERADGFSLDVENPGMFSLSIRPLPWLFRIVSAPDTASAKQRLQGRFEFQGVPQRFREGAIDLIGRSDPRLLASLVSHPPHIQLNGSRLVCVPADPTYVNDTIAFLNLCCDLAELAEQMGGHPPAVIRDTDRGQATH
jgi:hypothetical protein